MQSKWLYASLCFILLLASCNQGSDSHAITPPIAPLHTPASTKTSTTTFTPTPNHTATPAFYPTIAAGSLPPVLQEFLDRYDSFEEMNAAIQKDYRFIAIELNGRPAGSLDSSPLSALSQGISDCYETAVISALLGEKLGYKPYLLVLEHPVFSPLQPHSIHVFQDAVSGKWGYNDYLLELQQPAFDTIKELADFYIKSHPLESGHYDFWYLVDMTKINEAYGLDWRITTKSIRFRDKIIVETGVYIP
jgi:hypothetical protein